MMMKLQVPQYAGNFRLAKQLTASEELISMELVNDNTNRPSKEMLIS
jgi:hypothetical protein